MTKTALKFMILLFVSSINAQKFSSKIIDKSTKLPIPYAAVQTDEHKGVITNEEGVFTINLENNQVQQVTISSLGFKTQAFTITQIKENNLTIELEPSVNELNTVYLSNTKNNVDSIITKVIKNIDKNYRTENLSHKLFYRETSYMDFEKLDFEIKRASHVKKKQLIDANNSLTSLANNIASSNFVHFTDFMGNLSVNTKNSTKLEVEKAAQIINANKDFSMDNIQEKAQNIVLKYLDTTLTYKLKTGLFKVEDSLSLSNDDHSEIDKDEFDIKYLKSNAIQMLNKSRLSPNSLLRKVLNSENYSYELKNVSFYNNEMVYSIEFKPKRSKSKYTGTIYVGDDSYAILKTDYSFSKGKRGDKFNLRLILGFKYIENVSNGIIIYKKNTDNWYEPRYIKQESGQYFYVNRPLKFIENSKSKNKVLFNFKIEGDAKHKEELLFTDTSTITKATFENIKEEKTTPYQKQRKYDASVWGTNETLVPTEELKTFDATKD